MPVRRLALFVMSSVAAAEPLQPSVKVNVALSLAPETEPATLAVFLSLWLTIAVHPWNGPSAAPAAIPPNPAQPTSTAVLQTSPVTPAVQPISHLDE